MQSDWSVSETCLVRRCLWFLIVCNIDKTLLSLFHFILFEEFSKHSNCFSFIRYSLILSILRRLLFFNDVHQSTWRLSRIWYTTIICTSNYLNDISYLNGFENCFEIFINFNFFLLCKQIFVVFKLRYIVNLGRFSDV